MVNTNKKDLKINPEEEFKLLRSLDSPNLINHIGEDFYFNEFYCFVTEFGEVIEISLII